MFLDFKMSDLMKIERRNFIIAMTTMALSIFHIYEDSWKAQVLIGHHLCPVINMYNKEHPFEEISDDDMTKMFDILNTNLNLVVQMKLWQNID